MTVSKEIKDRLINALITAIVFAAALAWKDTMVLVLNSILPGEKTIWSDVIVSFAITGTVLVLIYGIIKGDNAAENNLLTFTDTDEQTETREDKKGF